MTRLAICLDREDHHLVQSDSDGCLASGSLPPADETWNCTEEDKNLVPV